MKFFSERNPLIIGAIGFVIMAAAVVGALQYDKLPFFNRRERTMRRTSPRPAV